MWKTSRTKENWPTANSKATEIEKTTEKNLATLLTVEQCREIVRKFNENSEKVFTLLHHKITRATEVTGFLGEYYHLYITATTREFNTQHGVKMMSEGNGASDEILTKCGDFNDGSLDIKNGTDAEEAVLKFFIKKLPEVDEEHETNAIFRKESGLYKLVFTELEKYAPIPWFPKLYLNTSQLLVLQDLNNLGYHTLAHKDNLGDSEIYGILKGLASMHASSLLYELSTGQSIEKLHHDYLNEITVHPQIAWFTTGLKALMEIAKQHSKYQSDLAQEYIQKQLPHHLTSVYDMVNPSRRHRNVLCHRDTWGGNIFINPQDSQASAMFVDFQTCRYCPPAVDVIFTLFMNLTKEKRLAKQRIYLKYYWQQLESFTGSEFANEAWGITEDGFLKSYKELQLFGYVYRALAFTILRVPKVIVTDEYKNVERSEKLLGYMKENETFRLLMEECLEDVIEAVINY